MKIEYDTLELAQVNGQMVRIAPLVVRGADRRQAPSDFSIGAPYKITLNVTSVAPGVYELEEPPASVENRVILNVEGSPIIVDGRKVKRVERRSGVDRRQA